VQMIYIDPPYGIKYGSNFQPFVNKRDVKDGKDEDLTQEPEMIKAFRDTWELGIHSYLSYLRDRLLIARELLTESGSIFVQISDENLHHVKELMEEIFGVNNFCGIIAFRKTGGLQKKLLASIVDYIIWYSKDKNKVKYNQLYNKKKPGDIGATQYRYIFTNKGDLKELNYSELLAANEEEVFTHDNLTSQGNPIIEFTYKNKKYSGRYKTTLNGLSKLADSKRILALGNTLRYIRYMRDFPYTPINEFWHDTGISGFEDEKKYVVQTSPEVIARCILMTTVPGDLVFDPTCGSGTTAYTAELWGRRWITCDTSHISVTLAKERLMTAVFEYYSLGNPMEGVQSGFNYNTAPHITLKSIVNNEPPETIELYDQPQVDNTKTRVTGPFTVEAVPAPYVIPVGEMLPQQEADTSVSRIGETHRQGDWRSELLKTGIRAKGGQTIKFTRVETLKGARWLHAEAETNEAEPKRVVISFGPEHAPLEQKQVEKALEEASHLYPKPKMVVFTAFQFDPEAAKDIDEAKINMTLLKVQMNADLLTKDLKKKQKESQSFWLIGQPDVSIKKIESGLDAGKTVVIVNGFDYYDPRTGEVKSGGQANIAIWMLDPDYDGRSLYPRQVFFPMANSNEGWAKLARNLKAEVDLDLIEQYRGNKSIPFTPGDSIAVKIVDDRGIESLKIIRVS